MKIYVDGVQRPLKGRPDMARLGLTIALIALSLDWLSKWWVMNILDLKVVQQVQILPFFTLQWAENRGISFSMFTADGELGRWILVAITVLIVIGLGFWLRSVHTRLLAVALGLVIGGAIGNIHDRALYGYVVDFFQFHVGNWSFAIFNVADSAISIGAALLIWDAFWGQDKKQGSEKTQ